MRNLRRFLAVQPGTGSLADSYVCTVNDACTVSPRSRHLDTIRSTHLQSGDPHSHGQSQEHSTWLLIFSAVTTLWQWTRVPAEPSMAKHMQAPWLQRPPSHIIRGGVHLMRFACFSVSWAAAPGPRMGAPMCGIRCTERGKTTHRESVASHVQGSLRHLCN